MFCKSRWASLFFSSPRLFVNYEWIKLYFTITFVFNIGGHYIRSLNQWLHCKYLTLTELKYNPSSSIPLPFWSPLLLLNIIHVCILFFRHPSALPAQLFLFLFISLPPHRSWYPSGHVSREFPLSHKWWSRDCFSVRMWMPTWWYLNSCFPSGCLLSPFWFVPRECTPLQPLVRTSLSEPPCSCSVEAPRLSCYRHFCCTPKRFCENQSNQKCSCRAQCVGHVRFSCQGWGFHSILRM